MSTFVLVHGAWHGAWCWDKVVPGLARAGHAVLAPDLASLGRDRTPVADVSLERWAEDVCKLIDTVAEPVVLVGHSRGGIVISEVAERRPDRIATLVYLTAFLLQDGETLLGIAETAEQSLVASNLIVADDRNSMTVRDDVIAEAFYAECTPEDVALARALLRPEATAPAATPVRVTQARFGSVPKVYIECLRDKAIPIALQRAMARDSACAIVASLDTDHSPFFSSPRPLSEALLAIASGRDCGPNPRRSGNRASALER
jgi:pimeloyl-ACP methyl ester carboxylesterase